MKGGTRPGAGRPPSSNPATKQIKVLVTPTQHATWLHVGASKWLKRILDELKEKKQCP